MRKDVKHIALLLCALLWSAASLYARMYNANEKVFINVKQSDGVGDWSQSNAKLFLYFFQSTNPSNSEWVELSRVEDGSKYFIGTITPNHPWFDRVSVVRKSEWGTAGNWDERWNQSCDIKIPDNGEGDYNLLYEFKTKNNIGDNCTITTKWYYYPVENPTLSSVIANIEKEIAEVCTQSSGDPLSLQPRLINETDGYDYDQEHTWFKWNGEKWIELPNSGDWGFNGPGGLNETIGAANSHTYYFLLSTKASTKQRFIEISVTKDCSPSCEITDFGVVTSSVNVHDSTYVLEGVVAFGESLGKTLRISVTDAKGEHHVDYNAPTTPFIFSLPELYADGAELTATASFIGGGSECTRNSDPYPAPNAISGINTTTINVTHGETPTLTPSTPGTDGFKWHDGNTTDHDRVVPAYCFDTTVIYTYYEYEPKPTFAGNLIDNGDFSADESYYGEIKRSNDVTGCDISDYNFWGKEVTTESNFYDKYMDGGNSLFGGFSIVTDANSFWKRYTKKIDAKAGTYYALFDADNTGSKKAWYTNTGKSSKLKLVKGTNYMFSFWVANINNYGEMNNAAKLQFAIRYKQDGAWSEEELLGNPIDLNEYKDNIWHQNSHVYTSPVDADEVEIMVRDLNTSKNPGGNDFALDDIQFQAISVHSQAIKNCERFIVNIKEPDITVNKPKIDILKTPACGKTDFELQVQVSYSKLSDKCPANTITLQLTDDIYGDIFTTPITIDPILNPEGIILTLSSATYAMLVADGKDHNLTVTITRKDGQGKEKSWQNTDSYTAPGVPALTVTAPIVPKPDCDQTTFDLEVKTTYAYQSGTELLFYWDGDLHTEASKSISYGPSSTITTKLTGLTYDGKKHTLLVHTDNTTLDCQDSKDVDAPFSPRIYDFTATPEQMDCDEKKYNVTVTFFVTNGQGKEVTVWGKEDQHTTFAAKEGENTVKFEDVAIDAADDYFDIWFVEAEANCLSKKTAKYDEPVTPKISIAQGPEVGDMGCNLTTYTVKFDITHTNQSGKLYGWIDSGTKKEFSYEKNPATVTFTEVPGDGLEHTLHAEFDGENSCSLEITDFKAPFTPVISDVKITRSEMKCGEKTFNVTVEATLSENAKGHKLTITGDTGKDEPVTYDITYTKFSEVFTLDRDKATGKFFIYFADANNCEPQTYTYDPPKVPNLDVNPVVIPAPNCDQTTFDLTISGTYTYLHGTELQFLWDGVEKARQTITSLSDVETFSATLKDLAYDGQKHVLTVQSDETTYDICPFEQTDIDVPFSPDIKSTVAKVLPYVCDAPNYQVTITVTYEKTQGHDLIITDEAGHEKTLKATDAEYGETSASWTFDMPWENPVVEHTFKAYFEGAEGCKDEDSHKDSYIAPKYWSSYTWEDDSSLEETFYICPDGSKYWNGETYSVAGDYEKKLQTVHGCDSIVMLHLLYWPTYTWETDSKLEETFYICPNGSKEWNGKIYTEEGDYELSLKTVHECDSIVMLHLRYYSIPSLEDRTTDDVVFKENLPYIWEGNEYTISGNYEATKTTSDGCVYSVYLHLTVTDKPVENLDPEYMTICPGATIEAWHDLTNLTPTVDNYKFTTTITDEDKNYIATLIVNFYPIPSLIDRTKEDVVFTENLPYIWEGNEYTVSGNYEATKTTEDECEYSVYLHLTVNDKPVENLDPEYMTICPGATIEAWHDLTNLTPTAENNVFTTTIHEADKDYKATLIVNFHPIPSMTERTTEVTVFTENLPYIWEGEEYTVSGNYEATKTTEDECEYSVYLHLTVTDKPVENLDPEYMTICPGATIEAWRDLTNLTPTAENNVFTTTIHEADKDYKAKLIVDFYPIPSLVDRTTDVVVFTENIPYIWEGEEYTVSGNYETTKTTEDGCEYSVYLHLTVTNKPVENLEPDYMTICPGATIDTWHDLTNLTPTAENNVFTTTIHEADKDYKATLIVDFHPIPSITERTTVAAVFTENLPYIWEGNEYTVSGNYEATKTTADGCEYKIYLNLTVSDKIIEILDPEHITICPGTTIDAWHDLTNLTPTAENNVFTTTIHDIDKDYFATLIVDFHPIPSMTERTKVDAVFKENLPYIWEGNEYNESGNYEATKTTDNGCEYSVYLQLTVTEKPVETLEPPDYMTICPGATIDTWHDLTNLTPTPENNIFTTTIHEADKDYVAKLIVDFYPIPSLVDRTTDVVVFTDDLPYRWEGQDCMVSDTYEATKTTDDGCEYKIYLNLTVTDKPIEILDPEYLTICPGATIDAWRDLTDLTPTAENNVFTTTIHDIDKDYKAKLIVSFFPVPTIEEATTNATVIKDDLPFTWNGEQFYTEQIGYTKVLQTADGCEYTATLNLTIASDPIVPKPEITATASVMPYACGDHTYSVNVQVEFANGQGHDLIVEDWKGNKQVFTTTPADTKIDDPIFEYQKYTPGGKHGFKVYFDGYEDCAVYAYYIEPAQPKIDNIHTDIGSVTGCNGTTYDLTVTFDYYNQDGALSVDLDGRIQAKDIKPAFVQNSNIKQSASAKFEGLKADGLKHKLTVKTINGIHNCEDSVTVDAPQAEDIITSVEVTDVPEDIRCDQTEYDVIVTVTMSSDNAIGKKIIIAHEGQTDDFIATANPMETTVKMTTTDATGLTMDAYFNGHPECKATSKTFDAPKRLSCVKDHEKLCQGDSYTWPVTGLTYGPFTEAGMDTFVNALNVLDTLIVTVYPTYNMPEEQVTIIDGETYTWNGKDYEAEGIYKENLLSEHDCDSIVTLNLTVKENIVEDVSFTIAEQCAGPGALEIVIHHTGLLTDARLTFSPEAVAAGFVNDTYPIEKDTVTVPYNVKAGIFSVNIDLLFHSRLKHSSIEPFTLLFPHTVLEQGWMDAIFVLTHDYNGGYDFTDFQWYKKGQMLVGETGPYLYQPLEVGAEYSAMLTEVSGLKLMTCPLIVTEHTDITLYPTVVTRKDLIHVNVSQDARLTLYSIMGERHNSYSLLSGDTQINAPGTQGIYLAEIVLESGQRKVIKIMVR